MVTMMQTFTFVKKVECFMKDGLLHKSKKVVKLLLFQVMRRKKVKKLRYFLFLYRAGIISFYRQEKRTFCWVQ
jgi:hypothetical protein